MKKLMINSNYFEIEQTDIYLIDFLRDKLFLTGTKNGCGIGVCGACTILINNIAKKSCRLKVSELHDFDEIITIEGFRKNNGELHPLQQAFIDYGAIQCGFCTPGMILTAHAFLLKNSQPTEEEIKFALKGNLCRCTGYKQIIDAVLEVTKHYNNNQ